MIFAKSTGLAIANAFPPATPDSVREMRSKSERYDALSVAL